MRERFAAHAPVALAAAACLLLLSGAARAQGMRGTTPPLEQRRENERLIRNNERLRRGMEVDSETRARTKEERQAIVNEAFMRLQVLHNDIMAMTMAADAPDPARVAEAVAETKRRAQQLRANLALPEPGKDEKKKQEGAEAAEQKELKESLNFLCALIKSFVINLNNSPANDQAAEQARRDLDSLIIVSDKISASAPKAAAPAN